MFQAVSFILGILNCLLQSQVYFYFFWEKYNDMTFYSIKEITQFYFQYFGHERAQSWAIKIMLLLQGKYYSFIYIAFSKNTILQY